MEIMINLPQILIWPVEPYKVYLKSRGPIKIELWAKEVDKMSIM